LASRPKQIVGWREWIALPGLNLPVIKAKIDTGARTSALHAFYVEPIDVGGRKRVRFGVHPVQRRKDIALHCETDILDQRWVADSGGHRELRYVIEVEVGLAGEVWPVEMTLTDRDTMQFRLLLGRTAMRGRLMVDPGRSYRTGRISKARALEAYSNVGMEPSS